MPHMNDFDDYPAILLPQNWGKRMDFEIFPHK